MRTLYQDIRFGIRMLKKAPSFTAIALVTLAIGIGANTIMFSIVNALVFRPVQVTEPERLVCCKIHNFGLLGMMPYSAYHIIRDDSPVFSNLMVQDYGIGDVTLAHGQTARQVCGMFVSANYFSFLGVTPAFGRGFLPEEEHQGAPSVAVLSFRTWQRLGADPEMVGQHVRVNGVSCEVIGVAPEGFTGVTHFGPDLWLPLGSHLRVVRLSRGKNRPGKEGSDRGYPEVIPVGRLKPGLSMSAAQAQLQALTPRLKEKYPRQWKANCSLYLHRPPRFAIFNDDNEGAALSGISLVLGATKRNIMGMILREGLVLTMVGLLVGLLLGLGVAKISASLLYGISPVDPVSICVTVALLGAASLLACYIPARRATKIDPMRALSYE